MCLCLAARGEDEVFFRWNPPDGLVRQERLISHRRAERPDAGGHVDRKETLTEVAYHSQPTGYVYAATQVAYQAARDGTPTFDLRLALFNQVPLQYHLDMVGRLREIDGLAALVVRARSMQPDDPRVPLVVREENYRRERREAWDQRYGRMVGKRGKLGDSWRVSDEYLLPGDRRLVFHITTKLVEKLRCADHDCVRLEFFYHSTPEPRSATWEIPFIPPTQVKESEITGWGERILDPSTMLIYLEREVFVIRFKPGELGPQPVVVEERVECSFSTGGRGER
ncbi:hypothetical protein HS125_00275 [bacterium]|nr:hypothetical protein [bacterium]